MKKLSPVGFTLFAISVAAGALGVASLFRPALGTGAIALSLAVVAFVHVAASREAQSAAKNVQVPDIASLAEQLRNVSERVTEINGRLIDFDEAFVSLVQYLLKRAGEDELVAELRKWAESRQKKSNLN